MTYPSVAVLTAVMLALGLPGQGQVAPPPGAESPDAWLDRIEQELVNASGHTIMLHLAGSNDPIPAVFHAPLSSLWLLEEPADNTEPEVLSTARLERNGADGDTGLFVIWDQIGLTTLIGPDLLPNITTTGHPHPLAIFHNRLLSLPLARPVAGLPEGTRFEVPAGGSRTGLVRIPGDASGIATLWQSLGDHIVITKPDGQISTLRWQELDAALTGDAK